MSEKVLPPFYLTPRRIRYSVLLNFSEGEGSVEMITSSCVKSGKWDVHNINVIHSPSLHFSFFGRKKNDTAR